MTIQAKYADLEPYLRHITHRQSDPTYSVLKAHLLFEEMLRDYLQVALPHPSALTGARLSFAQLLAVTKATAAHIAPDSWHWSAIVELNRLRNQLAHNLAPAEISRRIDSYIELIAAKGGMPLPAGAITGARSPSFAAPSEQLYSAVDMVTAALYMYSAASFGLVPTEVLAARASSPAAGVTPEGESAS
ncbi:hypothetical protein LP414_04140 [Polaromonas sp. P1(28)-13]|nr:hypothetical protein LP416_05190 [Polaromonas sp. P2-4]UUZ76755.1 hypothetical protein LP414_04140 [Polaromonas sp. P1(28)-13]